MKYEYKIEFEADFNILPIINKINEILVNSKLNNYAKSIKPTFTILKEKENKHDI
jgi:hypothetical protein